MQIHEIYPICQYCEYIVYGELVGHLQDVVGVPRLAELPLAEARFP